MPDYLVFGGRLRSELTLPEAPTSEAGTPTWTFRIAERRPPPYELWLVGETSAGNDVARLYFHSCGYRLVYSDTGSYDISRLGDELVWYPEPGAPLELVCADLLGPVLALALHQTGTLCLHGAAVAVREEGIAFLAPKFHGKSTLALALAIAGAQLITDDMVAVDAGPPVVMRPGVRGVRLWADSAEQLGVERLSGVVLDGIKRTVTNLRAGSCASDRVPLRAIYVLTPIQPGGEAPASRRTVLSQVPAALSVMSQTKLGALLGSEEHGILLQRVAALVRAVPVYSLAAVRDFNRLTEVVERLLQWHEPSGTSFANSYPSHI